MPLHLAPIQAKTCVASLALLFVFGGSIALTDSLSRYELFRGMHGPGALLVTFPVFLLFGAGAIALGVVAALKRRDLGTAIMVIGLLPSIVAAGCFALILLLVLQ